MHSVLSEARQNDLYFKIDMGQSAFSFIGPSMWNKTSEVLKKTKSSNTFKHNLKKILPNITQLKWAENKL